MLSSRNVQKDICRLIKKGYAVGSIRPTKRRPYAPSEAIAVYTFGDALELSSLDWLGFSTAKRLNFIRAVIGYAAAFEAESVLSWSFSSATIPCAEASRVTARWDETGEPPVFSLLSLEFDKDIVRTVGLKALAGLEIEAINVQSRTSDAMNLVARLARHVLLFRPSFAVTTVSTERLKATLDMQASAIERTTDQLRVRIHDMPPDPD